MSKLILVEIALFHQDSDPDVAWVLLTEGIDYETIPYCEANGYDVPALLPGMVYAKFNAPECFDRREGGFWLDDDAEYPASFTEWLKVTGTEINPDDLQWVTVEMSPDLEDVIADNIASRKKAAAWQQAIEEIGNPATMYFTEFQDRIGKRYVDREYGRGYSGNRVVFEEEYTFTEAMAYSCSRSKFFELHKKQLNDRVATLLEK